MDWSNILVMKSNYEEKHKTKAVIEFSNVVKNREKRLSEHKQRRKTARFNDLDVNRQMEVIEEKKKPSSILQTDSKNEKLRLRLMQLQIWKKEKEKKKAEEAKNKKVFVVSSVKHTASYAPPPPPPGKKTSKTEQVPSRTTRSTTRRNEVQTQEVKTQPKSFAPKNAKFHPPESIKSNNLLKINFNNVQTDNKTNYVSSFLKNVDTNKNNDLKRVTRSMANKTNSQKPAFSKSKPLNTNIIKKTENKENIKSIVVENNKSPTNDKLIVSCKESNMSSINKINGSGKSINKKVESKNPINKKVYTNDKETEEVSNETCNFTTPVSTATNPNQTTQPSIKKKINQQRISNGDMKGSPYKSAKNKITIASDEKCNVDTTAISTTTTTLATRLSVRKQHNQQQRITRVMSPKIIISNDETDRNKTIDEEDKELEVKDNLKSNLSTNNKIDEQHTTEKSTSKPDENVKDINYFHKLLECEIIKMINMANEWKEFEDSASVPEQGQDLIRQAVCQTQLLINKKLKQYRELIDQCKNKVCRPGEGIVTLDDVQGFWDMVCIQIDDIFGRFNKLKELKDRNWVEDNKVIVVKKENKKHRAKPKPKTSAPGKIREIIAAARKKALESKNSEMLVPEVTAIKTFEGGFFSVQSPIKPAAIPRAPPHSRRSLALQNIQLADEENQDCIA